MEGLGRAPVAAEELVEFLDGEGGAGLGRDLRVLRDAGAQHGWGVRGMAEAALRATGGVDGASVELSAAVAASGGTRSSITRRPTWASTTGPSASRGGGGHAALGGVRRPRRPSGPPPGRSSSRGRPSTASSPPPPRGSCRRAARCSSPSSCRDRAKRQRLLRAGGVPRAEVVRRLRLVQRLVPGRAGAARTLRSRLHGARRTSSSTARRAGGRPTSPPPSAWRGLRGAPREVLADGPSSCCSWASQARGDARQAARRRGQGEAPGPGRVRLRALRRGRARLLYQVISESCEEEERDIHHQRRVQQVGHRLRGRQARGGDRRPRRAPRQARGVRGRATGWRGA